MFSSVAAPRTVFAGVTTLGLTYSQLLGLQEVLVLIPEHSGIVADLVAGVDGGATDL